MTEEKAEYHEHSTPRLLEFLKRIVVPILTKSEKNENVFHSKYPYFTKWRSQKEGCFFKINKHFSKGLNVIKLAI